MGGEILAGLIGGRSPALRGAGIVSALLFGRSVIPMGSKPLDFGHLRSTSGGFALFVRIIIMVLIQRCLHLNTRKWLCQGK
jgi:hypothetical protein